MSLVPVLKRFVFSLLILSFYPSLNYAESASTQGKVTGGIAHEMPDWFKESFLALKEDVAEAKEANKHVMLFFHLENCPYCAKMLDEGFLKEPLKSYIKKHFDVIAINVKGDREVELDTNQSMSEKELAKKLEIRYTPTILLLDNNNTPIHRINGYRAPEQFEPILNFVAEQHYKSQSLDQYLSTSNKKPVYELKDNTLFQAITDFSTIKTPLAIMFEDKSCIDCEYFHTKVLTNKDVLEESKSFTIVRLEATSTQDIIDTNGNKINPKAWSEQLKLDYRPGIILFQQGKEVARMDGLLFPFHFQTLLRYVSTKEYEKLTFPQYLGKRQAELVEQGINITLGE